MGEKGQDACFFVFFVFGERKGGPWFFLLIHYFSMDLSCVRWGEGEALDGWFVQRKACLSLSLFLSVCVCCPSR
jgi:hypothetical protein